MKKKIKELVLKIIKASFKETADFSIEVPIDKNNGDYTTNVALVLANKIGKNPLETANLIKEKLEKQKNNLFKDIKIAGPGFINFFIKDKFFIDSLKKIDKNFGKGKELKNQKVIIEYTDPNILKEFHIGHLMSNVIGESISRILEFSGGKVKRANYQGDVGLNVAKAVWGKLQNPNQAWQEAYVTGNKNYEDNELAKKEIIELNKKIFERIDKRVNKIYDEGKKWSLKYFEDIYKKLGTKFDYYFFESEVVDLGKKLVKDGLKKGIFEEGENGAIIFKGEKYGLHTRVFINSEGLPTYEAKDLALPQIKYNKYKYEKSIIFTASEQNAYFKVMLFALKQTNLELAEKTKHIGHGMLRLSEGKMSSRTGNVIAAESLIQKAKEMISEKIKNRGFSNNEKNIIAQQVAIASIKYSILKQSIGSNIIYDFDKSISFDGDSGPYLQYSFTRAHSVLQKAKKEKIKASFKNVPKEINQLEKTMSYFTEVVEKASKEYEPHFIALYLTELAREFNNYYTKNKIVDKNDEFSPYKIALTGAFSIIMKNGLWLLGIDYLEKM